MENKQLDGQAEQTNAPQQLITSESMEANRVTSPSTLVICSTVNNAQLKKSSLPIFALVAGIVSWIPLFLLKVNMSGGINGLVILVGIPFSLIIGVVAIVIGTIALAKKKTPESMSIIGIIIGLPTLVIGGFLIFIMIGFMIAG